MTRFGLVVAWIAATALTTAVAWQVVGAADDRVSDEPTTPVIAVTVGTDATVPGSDPQQAGPSSTTAVGSSIPSTTPTSSESSTTTGSSSTGSAPGSSTSTTSPGSTSTTSGSSSTTTPGTGIPATTTAVSDGGTLTVTGVAPNVELVAVVANPGWSYRITHNDGDRVEVIFERSDHEIRIRCQWEGGRLVADIDD